MSEPTTVEKPWGHELIWARTDRYVGKILHVKAGEALWGAQSRQMGFDLPLAPP